MERNQEERLRALEDQRLIDRTEKIYQKQTDEQSRRKRTELIAWIALLVGGVGLVLNIYDKVA